MTKLSCDSDKPCGVTEKIQKKPPKKNVDVKGVKRSPLKDSVGFQSFLLSFILCVCVCVWADTFPAFSFVCWGFFSHFFHQPTNSQECHHFSAETSHSRIHSHPSDVIFTCKVTKSLIYHHTQSFHAEFACSLYMYGFSPSSLSFLPQTRNVLIGDTLYREL